VRGWRWLAVVLAVACGAPPRGEAIRAGAKVGGVTIEPVLIEEVARAQGLEPRGALDALIDDALMAEGARERGPTAKVRWGLTSARARLTARRIAKEAMARGEPTDAEIEELVSFYWRRFRVPERVRVVHAVVLRRTPADSERGQKVARRIEQAVIAAKGVEGFEAAAAAVEADGFEVRVERLPGFAEDGRVVEGEGGMDLAFVHAAFGLRGAGETTGVVETRFGWHVIRLGERLAAWSASRDESRAALGGEALAKRAWREREGVLGRQRGGRSIEVLSSAERQMALIPVE
jgi:hypothetical protein